MRIVLDWIYRIAAILAALSLAGLLVMLALQIVVRAMGSMVVWSDDIASFLLVATSFLAMAGTFRNGVHVRVSLLVNRAGPRSRRALEIGCMLLCVALALYLAYASVDQVMDSYRFDERTTGIVPFSIWIPQSIMCLGIVIFCIATIDALVDVLRGKEPSYLEAERLSDPVSADSETTAPDSERPEHYAAAE
jgi:TRAP-type C4-dicarboxylate transport system permease small subunit